MNDRRYHDSVISALEVIRERCPRVLQACYWAGTAAISTEELNHRHSYDIDLHTKKALQDTRPLLAEIRNAFPGSFELTQSPDEFGSGFQGVLTLPGGEKVTLEVLANHEDLAEDDVVPARLTGLQRVSLKRYLADKIQCVAEREEARDLIDIGAVLDKAADLEPMARQLVNEQDAALIAERLLNWTEEKIAEDLAAYPNVSVDQAMTVRNNLLSWLREAEQ